MMLSCFVMLSLAVCAVFFDLRTDRIPNELTAAGCAAGILLQTGSAAEEATQGTSGLLFYSALLKGILRGAVLWAGAVVPLLLIGVLLHRFHLLGGGDTKLLAALAGVAGVGGVLPFLGAVMAAGGVLSVCIMVRFHIFRERMRVLKRYAKMAVLGIPPEPYREEGGAVTPAKGSFHFSVPILLGVVWTAARQIM